MKPRRVTNTIRLALIYLARWFDWRQALAVVQPATLIRWQRQGFRLFWRWKSTPGRPPIPPDLQALIRRMARENPTWGEERIANELLLKLGLQVSPRTVRKYLPKHLDHDHGKRALSQRWRTFVRNHAQAIIACDFCLVVTATFRLLYVGYRFLLHDRDSIFSQALDQSLCHLGLKILKTPPRSPQANALCERLLGTLRRECLDFLIPLTEHHLRRILREWAPYYNTSRPHMALGPGIPQPPSLPVPLQAHRHRLPEHLSVVSHQILGGLHHAYGLAEQVA